MSLYEGTFELVNPRVIVVDHRYQRVQKPVLIALISRCIVWEAFGAVVCLKRENGIFYCVDGQQRLAGVLQSAQPPMTVPVIWYPSQSLEHEARIFTIINEYRKALAAMEKFVAKVVQKDPTYLQVAAAAERAGFSIGSSGGNARTITAVSALLYIYNLGGEDGVFSTLIAIRDAWDGDKRATDANILRGVGDVIAEFNGDHDRSKIAKAFSRTTPADILKEAKGKQNDMGGTMRTNIRRAIKSLAKI